MRMLCRWSEDREVKIVGFWCGWFYRDTKTAWVIGNDYTSLIEYEGLT